MTPLAEDDAVWKLLPPGPGVCPVCAAKHAPETPHHRDSVYYQLKFHQQHKRFPTWADAAAHCTDAVRLALAARYAEQGITLDPFPGKSDGKPE